MTAKWTLLMGLLGLFFLQGATLADDAPTKLTPAQAAWQAAVKAATLGPSDIPMIDQAVLHLPATMAFFPKAESNALMQAWGNGSSDRLVGIVVPKDSEANWLITLDHVAEGFVRDDDAKTWNADELLQSLKDGTAEQNKEREQMGVPQLDIVGWAQPPKYNAEEHRLVWSLKSVTRGAAADEVPGINYNTYALGRDGYFQVDLLSDVNHLTGDKASVNAVLKGARIQARQTLRGFHRGQ